MKFIKDLHEGDRVSDIYMCKAKSSATTKNGKNYENVTLQDKTGTIECKIWEPNDPGIDEFDKLDYVEINGEVTSFNGALQLNIRRARLCREGEYDESNYLPVSSRNNDEMFNELLAIIGSIENPWYSQLLKKLFVEDEEFVKRFRKSSAAKSVHHGFVGGLLEHTLNVTKLCDYYCGAYPVLKRDLLLTAAICHDIAKTRELSLFPNNDYTDEGQLLGHIVMGSQMVANVAAQIPGFPNQHLIQLQHCILAHHGKYEYGSPKVPSLVEAVALNYADDTDAKMETFKEIIESNAAQAQNQNGWMGYSKWFEANLRTTQE